MNIVTIDPSLNCTAVVINGSPIVYTHNDMVFTKKGAYKSWFEKFKDTVSYRTFEPLEKDNNYSRLETQKLSHYMLIVNSIYHDIIETIDHNKETIFVIEGYSYSSKTNAVLDLVSFGTILRQKLFNHGHTEIIIIPPLLVKQKSCLLTYGQPYNEKGKKMPCRDTDGLAGAKFKKKNMLTCVINCDSLAHHEYVKNVKECLNDLENMKNVPKPVEDVNDAFLMYGIIEYELNELEEYNLIDLQNRIFTK